ncbi:phospholipase D-like domain-containing protein [Paenirhodobacter populi]|uniref:Phospholipase D n=1 Tax=Paenirhodobacter populi TaxID=2306993 RepID=A0A443ITL6_9RHOB|nr:phospholipase D-like domain-containing protein [Sinirhodobacter populi]RWR11041.1 phospholipase [Sinirhodobacter populi]
MTTRDFQLQPGRNCWRIAPADRLAVIVDAADYFVAARRAMLSARHTITLIGWDFDARIRLGATGNGDDGPERLGDFLLWLADRTPGLQIRLLRWDTGAFRALLRGSMIWTILRWKAHPRITLRLDGVHPVAGSHHQKIVMIDDCLAFCGGIDITLGRWDTSEHLDDDPRRVDPNGRPLKPWHDVTTVFDGPAARVMGELARARWQAATGEVLPECTEPHDCWPKGVTPGFRDMRLGIARTMPKMNGTRPAHEIETAYLDLIAGAKRFIYAESQYFASRRIAHAIAERLAEEDGPEIVVVNPHAAEGWLEPLAMDSARARLVTALRRIDRHRRLRIYHPRTEGGKNIYVHAKVMIVDDRVLRVGSSNFNNRSLRLDTECDVILTAPEAEGAGPVPGIAQLRDRLIAEHLGIAPAAFAAHFARTGSLTASIEALRGAGRSLVPYRVPRLSGVSEWLADNEILDPNGPDEMFEHPARRGLFKGWDRLLNRLHHRA